MTDQWWKPDPPIDVTCPECDYRRTNRPVLIINEHHALRSVKGRRRSTGYSAVEIKFSVRLNRGDYDVHLPIPSERRAIRIAAGLTQEDVAASLFVHRISVLRWERAVGYTGSERLPGREPSGDLRRDYADLLRGLAVENSYGAIWR